MGFREALDGIEGSLKALGKLGELKHELKTVDLKDYILELRKSLLGVKEALLAAKSEQSELRSKIKALNAKLHLRAHLKDENGCLYEADDEGNRVGEPYCNLCYVREEKQFRLVHTVGEEGYEYHCDNCNQGYGHWYRGPPLTASGDFDVFD